MFQTLKKYQVNLINQRDQMDWAKEYLRPYCPNQYTVTWECTKVDVKLWGHFWSPSCLVVFASLGCKNKCATIKVLFCNQKLFCDKSYNSPFNLQSKCSYLHLIFSTYQFVFCNLNIFIHAIWCDLRLKYYSFLIHQIRVKKSYFFIS